MRYELEKEIYLVQRWFDNLKENRVNEEVLMLGEMLNDEALNSIHRQFGEQFSLDDIDNPKIIENKNIIYFRRANTDINKLFKYRHIFKRKILFVSRENIFYKNMRYYIDNKEGTEFHITNQESSLYYIENIDPMSLIKNKLQSDFFTILVKRLLFLIVDFSENNILFKDIKYNIYTWEDSVYVDIELLNKSDILTARLAVLIYRVATLDLEANKTRSGRFFHKQLGSKSKTWNFNLLVQANREKGFVHTIDRNFGNFKAYDLKYDESENLIREEIANNLISFKKYNFDKETISKITNLPISDIEKLINKKI